MANQHPHKKIERTPEDKQRLQKIRASFQADKRSLEELEQSGDYSSAVPQETYLAIKAVAKLLKEARETSGMSRSDVEQITGMNASTISRLERGLYPNTSVNTLTRLASAYGLHLRFSLEKAA